jgi:c-di-GMP-binding flagellar brake protein YcgR
LQIDEIIKGGDIELEVRYNGKSMSFNSNVALIIEQSILIAGIKVDNKTVGFSNQCHINFLFKNDGKLYIWENVKVSLIKMNDVIYHKIDLSGEGKQFNRRDTFRMYIGEDMPIYINTAAGPTAIDVLVKDISETGVGFISNEELDVERTFRLKLKDNGRIYVLSGIIVRKEILSDINSFLYGCRFTEKNNILGKYIAKKQSEQLRNKTKIYSSPVHNISN